MSHSHGFSLEEDNNDNLPKNKFKKVGRHSLQLLISLLLVAITPVVLNYLSQDRLEEAKNQNLDFVPSESQYFRAEVTEIKEENLEEGISGAPTTTQKAEAVIVEGQEKNKVVEISKQTLSDNEKQKLDEGDKIVVSKQAVEGEGQEYFFISAYRLDGIYLVVGFFILLVVLLAGLRGISAFLGMIFSIIVLAQFLIPEIITGQNVLLITFITSLVILLVSLYLSHGFNKRTTVAVASSMISITIATLAAILVVDFTSLTGMSSEEVMQLQATKLTSNLNMQGLLLSGIIIGCLGVLDDVTTAQAAAIEQISKANPKLDFKELFLRGIKIGHEHSISMVNTLAMAYAGSSLPLLLLFTIYNSAPLWVTINNEIVSEEIIRALIGSICLLLSVPVVTLLSARFLRHQEEGSNSGDHSEDITIPKDLLQKKSKIVDVM
jgi:uncharacterized membrane protein